MIEKIKKPTKEQMADLQKVPVEMCPKGTSGLSEIMSANFNDIMNHFNREGERFQTSDVIWFCSKVCLDDKSIKGWSGFMSAITRHLDFEPSRVIYLPFINSPPSNLNTIYTALSNAVRQTSEINQSSVFMTFDQPLYIKARDIVAHA